MKTDEDVRTIRLMKEEQLELEDYHDGARRNEDPSARNNNEDEKSDVSDNEIAAKAKRLNARLSLLKPGDPKRVEEKRRES